MNKVPETREEKQAQRFENKHSNVVIQGATPTMAFVQPVDADIQVAPVRPPLISSPADRFAADIEKGMPSSYLIQASLDRRNLKDEQNKVNKELQKYIEKKELDEFARQELNREWDLRERLMEMRRQKRIVEPREKIRNVIKARQARGRQVVPTISYSRVVSDFQPLSRAGQAVQYVDETQAEIARRRIAKVRREMQAKRITSNVAKVRQRMRDRVIKEPGEKIANVIAGRLARGALPSYKNSFSDVVKSKPEFGIV